MDYDYLKYKKILIVDDEADLREMVTSILAQDGFKTIRTAGTVAEALKICRDWEPDLAILDVMLPDGDGFSLFEQMRTFTEVPVLFLTARGEDEDKLKGLGLGADDYMVKPFPSGSITSRMARSGSQSLHIFRASATVPAVLIVLKPSCSKIDVTISRRSASSSTMRIFLYFK